MSFRRYVTFNTNDCSVHTGERIQVELNLPRRCGIVLRAAMRFGARPVTVAEITEHVNKRLNCLYSECDINTAFRKLLGYDIVTQCGKNTYMATPQALDAWKAVDRRRF